MIKSRHYEAIDIAIQSTSWINTVTENWSYTLKLTEINTRSLPDKLTYESALALSMSLADF